MFEISTAVCLATTGSMTFLLMVQILSHSWKVMFLEAPWDNTNSFRASRVSPLRSIPWTVGNLGSFQPSTLALSTNHCNFRLDKTVKTKFNLYAKDIRIWGLFEWGIPPCVFPYYDIWESGINLLHFFENHHILCFSGMSSLKKGNVWMSMLPPVFVFTGSHCMCHSFNGINIWTCKIISRINLIQMCIFLY